MKKDRLKGKDHLNAKLLSYSAAAGALLALGADAEAQIMYTDVDPDSLVVQPDSVGTQSIFEIDMNNDGILDVTIVAGNGDWYYSDPSEWHWWSVRAYPENGAELALSAYFIESWSLTYTLAKRFDADDLIGSDLGYYKYWSGPMSSDSVLYSWQLGMVGNEGGVYYNAGAWNDGETDKYLGIRFSLDEGSTFHHGWVRLDVAQDHTQFLVKDYAYESTAGKDIAAGDMGNVSVEDGLADKPGVLVSAYQMNIVISDVKANHAQAEVYNLAGQLLKSVQVNAGRTEIPMTNKGFYIVRVDVDGATVSSKVIVQ